MVILVAFTLLFVKYRIARLFINLTCIPHRMNTCAEETNLFRKKLLVQIMTSCETSQCGWTLFLFVLETFRYMLMVCGSNIYLASTSLNYSARTLIIF